MLSVQQARALALSLPGAEERDHFGSPSFRVGGKIFAQLSSEGAVAPRALLKLSLADQTALTMSAADAFMPEPQWGRHGWTHVVLDAVAPAMFENLLHASWRAVAPKRFLAPDASGR
jgi:hypothetical protein